MNESWANSEDEAGVDLHLQLDPALGRRVGVETAIRVAIRDGRLVAGARLPASRTLARQLGLARGTVTAAYDQLVAEGFLVAGQGSGTLVADLRASDTLAPDATEPTVEQPLDLRPGSPDVSGFPVSAWLQATRRALNHASVQALDYSDPRGLAELRSEVTAYLGRTRGVVASGGQVVITTGYLQSLSLLAAVAGSGPVAMEDPGLAAHRDVVRRAGRQLTALPVDDRGADARRLSQRHLAACDLAVVTPAHQYPLGVPLTPERRHQLVAWARARDAYVVEDDYDGEFRYDRQPVGALQGVSPDRVVYAGTTSKALAPGVRLGWMIVPRNLLDLVVDAKRQADLQTSAVIQLTVAELLRSHAYDRQVRAMRLRYRRRRDLLLEVLERRAGRHRRAMVRRSIAAGLQAVIRLPDEGVVISHAANLGLALSGLAEHFHDDGGEQQGIVVGFSKPPDSRYRDALEALARVLP
jgi:GntR family transcriptional regulator/MocR family aminotransferase